MSGATSLSAASAHLIAWLVLGLASAAVVGLTGDDSGFSLGAHHQAWVFAHQIALGLGAFGAIAAHRRFGGAQPRLELGLCAFCIDGLLLREDFAPRAGKLAAAGGPAALWLLLLIGLAAATVPLAGAAGRLLRRPLFRVVALLSALQMTVANHFVLERNYPGVHLHVAALAAILLGVSMTGLRISWDPSPRLRRSLLGALALVAAWGIVWRPPSGVLVRALSRSGSALAPFVAELHAWWSAQSSEARYARLETREDIPPSQPPMVVSNPIVVWVSIDCLRADLLADPAMRERLPGLFAVRDRAVWFQEARTPSTATVVALSSVFSGRYFSELFWSAGYQRDWQPMPHLDPSPRLPALLSEQGVTTVALHGSDWMEPESGVMGRFDEHSWVDPSPAFARRHFTDAKRLTDVAIERLAEPGDRPIFLFMHWMEAHAPYDLGGAEGSDRDRFLAELALVDRELARLDRALDAEPLTDRSVLVVTADHGEAFGEHHTQYHGVTLYEELVRVPLLVRLPDRVSRAVSEPVTLMDVAPTLLDLFGAATPGHFAGASLVPVLRGEPLPRDRPILMDSGRLMRSIVFEDGYKLIHDRRRGTVELYHLPTDPGETKNLVDILASDAERRLEVLTSLFAARELRRPGYEIPFRPP